MDRRKKYLLCKHMLCSLPQHTNKYYKTRHAKYIVCARVHWRLLLIPYEWNFRNSQVKRGMHAFLNWKDLGSTFNNKVYSETWYFSTVHCYHPVLYKRHHVLQYNLLSRMYDSICWHCAIKHRLHAAKVQNDISRIAAIQVLCSLFFVAPYMQISSL